MSAPASPPDRPGGAGSQPGEVPATSAIAAARSLRGAGRWHPRRIVRSIDTLRYVLVVGALSCLGYSSLTDASAGLAFVFCLLALAGYGLASLGGPKPNASRRITFLVVFSVGTMVACLSYRYYLSVNATPYPYGWSDDDYTFDAKALEIFRTEYQDLASVKDDLKTLGSGTWRAADYYTILLAQVYRLASELGFEPHPLYPRLLNVFCLSAIALLVHQMSRLCGATLWAARLAAYLCGLSPLMLFEAAHTYRDTIVSLGVTAFVAGIAAVLSNGLRLRRLLASFTMFRFLLLLVGAAIAGLLRDLYLVVLGGVIVMSAMLSSASRRRSLTMIVLVGVALVAALPLIVSGLTQLADRIFFQLEYYHDRGADASGSFSGAVFGLPYVASLPFRLVLRNIAPLPVPQALATETFQRIGTVLWFFGIPFLVRALIEAFRRTSWDATRSLRVTAVGFLAFYALNVATTLQDRHVVIYLPLASVLIGHHVADAPRSMRTDLSKMVIVGMSLAIVWLSRGALLGT